MRSRNSLRTVDVARRAGCSVQQVRNLERDGVLPPASRTASGYRRYTETHVRSALAYRALAAATGPVEAKTIMRAAHAGPRSGLLALLDDITSSWAPPSAWEGETSMGTPHTLPAPVMGDMIVGELAVHGWDLAVATGQRLELPADLLAHLHDTMFAGVEQGREMGLYGPRVGVPADAPTLDRILGLTGRDPAWA